MLLSACSTVFPLAILVLIKKSSSPLETMEIGTTEMSGFSWRDIDVMLERMQAISPAQVQAVAKKYLVDEGLTVAVLDPQARKSGENKQGDNRAAK